MAAGATAFLSEEDRPEYPDHGETARPFEVPEPVGPPEGDRASSRDVVLIADDDAFRESLAEIVGLEGYDALQAADGEEALEILRQHHVDVLILDLQMPLLDGVSVLKALWPPPPKIILLSAFARYGPEDIDHMGLRAKGFRSLSKPVPPEQLVSAVHDALEGLHQDNGHDCDIE